MDIDQSNPIYQDLKKQCYALDIPEDMHDYIIALIDFPSYDACIHQSFSGDERMQQFVIMAYNNLNRELGLGLEELEMSPIPPDDVFLAEDFQINW